MSNFTAPEPYSLPYSEEIKRGELTKKREAIPCNKEILDIMEVLKKEVIELIEMLSTMKLWVRLSRPKFEDGNNFGVDVQNDVLTSLTTGAASAKSMLSTVPPVLREKSILHAPLRKISKSRRLETKRGHIGRKAI